MAKKRSPDEKKDQTKASVFVNPDIIKIVNTHINEIESLEKSEISKIMNRYKEIRRDLRDRLDILPGETFTAQKLRGVLLQIDTALIRMKELLKEEMISSGTDISFKGVEHLVTEVKKFEKEFEGAITPINIDAIAISQETENLLINRYDASLRSYSEDLRSRIAMGLTNAAIQQVGYSEVVQDLSKLFQTEEWKLQRIARTELHNIYNMSKQRTMHDLKETDQVPDIKKALFHPMDSRTGDDSKQAAIQNLIVDIDKPFVYNYRRRKKDGTVVVERREFMVPPDRPNDRAILVPYREEWD